MKPAKGAALLLLLFASGGAAPAGAQAPPGTTGEFDYQPLAARHGETITVTGRCLFGGSATGVIMQVFVSYQDPNAGPDVYSFGDDFSPAADGSVNGSLVVPPEAPQGTYIAGGTCRAGDQVFFQESGPFEVTDAPTATTSTAPPPSTPTSSPAVIDSAPVEPLPRTGGFDSAALAAVGALLLAVGTAVVRPLRRR